MSAIEDAARAYVAAMKAVKENLDRRVDEGSLGKPTPEDLAVMRRADDAARALREAVEAAS